MSTYAELIQALKVLKSVKEKRHGIKSLASLCANPAFQVRIVSKGGWRDAILPLIISLDEDCRRYAGLAIANLSTDIKTHQQLLEEDVLKHLVPILHSEEVQEVVVYVLNALGNFATSECMWPALQQLGAARAVAKFVEQVDVEEKLINSLFVLANMTGDPYQRTWMMQCELYKAVWQHMTENRNMRVLEYSLALLRGLAVEQEAQEVLPRLGIVPHLVGIFNSDKASEFLKGIVLDIVLHLSFRKGNVAMMLQPNMMSVIMQAISGEVSVEHIPVGVTIIANLFENVEHHDALVSSPLFDALQDLVQNDSTNIQMHVIRAMMHLSLSPKYHHVILATGVVANVCPVAMTLRLPMEMRANALQMLGAVCATHPTTPTPDDVMSLLFLVCNAKEHLEIRRASMLVIANASSDKENANTLLNKSYIESLVITLSSSTDVVLVDYAMQFFHNMCKVDSRAGSMMMRSGWERHVFTFERLESLSITSAIYLCDTCRQLSDDAVVRSQLLSAMVIKSMLDAWVSQIEDPQIAPHLALMASAIAYHTDTHDEFVMQGGVRLVIDLYSRSPVEHVRLCCLLTILYLAETPRARQAIAQERGLMMLLTACENETHIDLVTNAMKALIPFASSDDFRPELGLEGGLDTFASFLFSESLSLQQLGCYLLQHLLELRANRRIFLGLVEEKKCEEDYLEPLTRFLPKVLKGPPKRIARMKKSKPGEDKEDSNLGPHDPFMLRTSIHCIALLSLEHSEDIKERFIELGVPHKFYDLFYSEQIDKSSGEAVMLFFANCLHSSAYMQGRLMKGIEVVPMLLSAKEMEFSAHTNTRCLSALLCVSRVPDFRRIVIGQLDLIMASINANLSSRERDEDFYSTTAVHCALLCELARASTDFHEQMAKAGVVEAFLVFMTVAGRGVDDEMCIELLMSAVFGISALVSSPKTGEQCMASMLFPATRLQLFMSLLRLPAKDIDITYHTGTIGIRALQRVADPAITPEELQVGSLDMDLFMERCGVKPAAFVYRNVIRTLGLLLAHPEMAERVQQAISAPRLVPTCLFALKDAADTYVNVYGFLLVATFSKHEKLRPGFVNDATIVNELLSGCRRGSSASGDDLEESVPIQLDSIGKGGAMWSGKSVALSKYLLSMVSLTNFAETIKEVYRINEDIKTNADGEQGTGRATLTLSNRVFMKKLSAVCLKDLDAEAITSSHKLTESQEFSALLKVIVVHNTFVTRIDMESIQRTGEVKIERIGVSPHFQPPKPQGIDLVPSELRVVFKTLKQMQAKCQGLLDIVEQCLDTNKGQRLITAILECLCGLAYISPLTILDPYSVYRVFEKAPEWIHKPLSCLLCNSLGDENRVEQSPEQESGELLTAQSDYLFPLISSSPLATRKHMLGALANLGPRPRFLEFIAGSGVFRVIKPLPNRTYFIEYFGLILECMRLLTNMSCHEETHTDIAKEGVVGFLRDVLRHSAKQILYDLNSSKVQATQYENVTVTFEEDDAPPLGLRIRWEVPPYVSEVLPDTPAARLETPLLDGDELIAVNGTDVTEMEQSEIEPFFETRPLTLVFRRTPDRPKAQDALHESADAELPQISKLDTYGNPEQYLECFNLCLITLHNLAANNKNHPALLAEPKILDTMLEVIVSEVLSPSLRRISFSMLTCLAQQKDISGRIFHDMAEYFRSCEKGDPTLQKYIMLCANLFYTSMKPEEVVPDTGMLRFVGRLAALETATSSSEALVEVLHGMSRAPIGRRGNFVSRETLVVMVGFIEQRELWDVQLRAFEAAYFLTLGACDPALWSGLELVPRMGRAAGKVREFAGRDAVLQARADGLFELVMRSADLCLKHEGLVKQLSMPELDRYLMDLFAAASKAASLTQVAVNLMTGLLKSEIGHGCWTRWKRMGVADKLLVWFRNHKAEIMNGPGENEEDSLLATTGTCLDSILHFLIIAVEMDSDLVVSLLSDDVVSCIASRILSHARWFKDHLGADRDTQAPDVTWRNTSYRSIAQLLTALVTNERGLTAMARSGLAVPLTELLALPQEDFRTPTLIILASLGSSKEVCEVLLKNPGFSKVLGGLEAGLRDGKAVDPEELEYLLCILDRSCCYPDLCQIVQEKLVNLLLLLPAKAETMDAQVMTLRALARCSFVNPKCLDLLPENGLACMHYMMAATHTLRNASPEDADSPMSIRRRAMIARLTGTFAQHPKEAKLVGHFCRAILCESVSISRSVCVGVFPDFDCVDVLEDVVSAFEESYEQMDEEDGKERDVIAAEVLNHLLGMMHMLLVVVFRQKSPGVGDSDAAKAIPPSYATRAMVKVFETLRQYLRLGNAANPQEENQAPAIIARHLLNDIRILFYMTALLREVCAAPVDSPWVDVVRSEVFFQVLHGSIGIATKRLQKVKQGKPPRNLFEVPRAGAARPSPIAGHLEDFDLALVFEHLTVCLRHTLVQAMFVAPAHDALPSDPWAWRAQEAHDLHSEAFTWIPDVLRRFRSTPSIKMEVVRYICAAATYYVAPHAEQQDPDTAGTAQDGTEEEESGQRGVTPRLALGAFCLLEPFVLSFLTEVLETVDDPCVLSLACLAVSNLAGYEQQRRIAQPPRERRDLPIDDLQRLVVAVVRVLKLIPRLPRSVGERMLVYAYRIVCNLLSFGDRGLFCATMDTGFLDAVKMTFDFFFRDVFKISSSKEYIFILQNLLLFLRNWITSGCQVELGIKQLLNAGAGASRKLDEDELARQMRVLEKCLDAPGLINLLTKMTFKMACCERDLPELDDDVRDAFYTDVLVTMRTLLKRSDALRSILWRQVDQTEFETILEQIKEFRYQRYQVLEDEEIMNMLYLMTKQAFMFQRAYFPDFFMQVAYGDQREGHTLMQDMAAVCCAIISSQNSKDAGSDAPTVNVAAVVKDHAKFLHQLQQVPDPRMQLWHYRLLVGWSLRPPVLEEISADASALKFVIDHLSDPLLGRYSIILLHNLSVLRHGPVLTTEGHLSAVCEAYRLLTPDPARAEPQRRLLRRLLLAVVRNCVQSATQLDAELSDRDLETMVLLCSAVEAADTPLYLATLMHVTQGSSPRRIEVLLPGHAPLAELLLRRLLEQASRSEAGTLNDSDLYDVMTPDDEDTMLHLEAVEERERTLAQAALASRARGAPSPTSSPKKSGLGKKMSLYQQRRMKKSNVTDEDGKPVPQLKQSAEQRSQEQEFIYFATAEVLTHTTFRMAEKKDPYAIPRPADDGITEEQLLGIDAADNPVRDALAEAFGAHPISKYLAALKQQVALHEKRKLTLSDLFMQVSAKFIWHCWSNPMCRPHFDTLTNLEILADLTPFFLAWPHEDVQRLAAEAALYAGLHRYAVVTDYLVDNFRMYPELACAMLTKAFVDEEAMMKPDQASDSIRTLVELLRGRLLTRTGVHRLATGVAVGIVQDHPEGLGAYLTQKEHVLLGELLEQLSKFNESGTIKACMVAALARTAGVFYKALPELDEFMLRVFEISAPLLESEFVLFFPVLHRFAKQGGKRAKGPMVHSHLHMRVARIMEQQMTLVERTYRQREAWEAEQDKTVLGPQMNARQKMQWMLAYFTALASAGENTEDGGGHGHDQDQHFDAFVCVDLLPILVRILKRDPHAVDMCGVMFLLASVARSPCLVPHMPDVLRLTEDALPAVIEPLGAKSERAITAAVRLEKMGLGPGASSWPHLAMSAGEARAELAVRRSLVHLLANAGFAPSQNPALLAAPAVFAFLSRLSADPAMYRHPTVTLHAKVYCLAQLCAHGDQQKAMDMKMLEILQQSEKQIVDVQPTGDEVSDLRLPWMYCAVSLANISGTRLLPTDGLGVDIILSSMRFCQEVLKDNLRLQGNAKGLHLVLESQQALAAAIGKLANRMDFGRLRPAYALFLLSLVCSSSLLSIRTSACEHLASMLSQGHESGIIGAVFLKTPCLLSFRQIVMGQLDDLAISCTKVMQALAKYGGDAMHFHLLPNLESIIEAIGNPNSNAARVLQLSQLFVDLTACRRAQVLDVVVELSDITPFLGLARSSQSSRRELVLKWLESFGSSLYEIDEVSEIFSASTLRGFLHMAARSTLEPGDAQDLRRVMFALVQKRVMTWRASLFGTKEFLSEMTITSTLAMCERQPDLMAAGIAMLHALIANDEVEVLERVWSGGHFAWLCQRMTAKSRAQLYAVGSVSGVEPTRGAVIRAWERHSDLVAAQGMALRVIWRLYDMFPTDLPTKAVKGEVLMKAWSDYLTYFAHYAWPLRETKEVEQGTDAGLILAMQILARVSVDVNADMQSQLIQQGAMGSCMTMILPNPQEQAKMWAAMLPEPDGEPEDVDTSEALLLPEARLIAGGVAAWLMQHVEAYKWFNTRRVRQYAIAMFSQLHHWRTVMMEQQGSISVVSTVSHLERYASLYVTLLSPLTVDWCLEMLGVGHMAILLPIFLDLWSRHANVVLKHHGLRMFSSFCQVHSLYASVFSETRLAEVASSAIHRIFGHWDARELRHVLRLLIASFGHALLIPVLPTHVSETVVRTIKDQSSCARLREMLSDGGLMRADMAAAKHILLPKYFSQVFVWSEDPGDDFARAWALWLAYTCFHYEGSASAPPGPPQDGAEERILVFAEALDEQHLLRRAKFRKEREAAARAAEKGGSMAAPAPQAKPPTTSIPWLRSSPMLATSLAKMAGQALAFPWKTSQQLACATSSRCFYELEQFQQVSVETLAGPTIVQLFGQPDKGTNLAVLMLTAVLSSYRLALKAQNVEGEFLKRFYDLAAVALEGFASSGQGPYDLAARWLHAGSQELPAEVEFRCLVAFLIGQCASPPLAVVPSLDLAGGTRSSDGGEAPPVAECDPPPAALLDKLAFETIKEDQRLRSLQADGKGPLFSAMLCHLLYALAVMVPLHPKAAANSATVRGAAFAQLMKVQSMVARGVEPRSLFDPLDGSRAKLFLYIKATASIRAALTCITGSWLAADFGARFAVTEEGGRDFIQYCTRHIQQIYNNKTALTRVLGTPWERVMLSQGPTSTIAELLMMICSTESNLKEVARLGGEQALHALSRYGESAQVKQQATMLLTKLAVMQQIR